MRFIFFKSYVQRLKKKISQMISEIEYGFLWDLNLEKPLKGSHEKRGFCSEIEFTV